MDATPQTINLGSVDKIPLGHGRSYNIGDREVAVFRPREGGLFATQSFCPHRQGPLAEGVIGGGKVICPLHGHKFNLRDGTGSEPPECVKVFPVQEVNGEILLQR